MSDSVDHDEVLPADCTQVAQLLFEAVKSKDVDQVQQIFDQYDACAIDLTRHDEHGHTYLGTAVEDGCLPVAKLLIQKGADLNLSDFYGMAPLHYATEFGHLDIVQYLISAGADLNLLEDRLSALHIAACKGQTEIARLLISHKSNVNALTRKGVSPLHCSVTNGHFEMTKLLLASGANVNLRGQSYHRTPVFLAGEAGNVEMVMLLMQHAARLNLTDQYGMTPLNIVCNRHHSSVAKLFIRGGASVNIADAKGNLPLHYAARSGDVDVARLLVDDGSKIDMLNKYSESPLHLAVRMQHADMVQLLVSCGCNTNICDISGGVTVLHVAVTVYTDVPEFEQIVCYLIDGGCNLDVRSTDGVSDTALYRALDLGKADLATILLQHGADVDVDCPHGVTILNKACQRGMVEFVHLLTSCSWQWRYERWLTSGSFTTGFRRRNLGRFHDDDVFDENEVPLVLWNRLPLYRFLRDNMSQPLSLQKFCRVVIRKQLICGGKLLEKIDSLNYPGALKQFLKLNTDY